MMELEIWQEKFPEVSFNDKVMILFEDGTEETLKHLYLHNDLSDIDWSRVIECWEV